MEILERKRWLGWVDAAYIEYEGRVLPLPRRLNVQWIGNSLCAVVKPKGQRKYTRTVRDPKELQEVVRDALSLSDDWTWAGLPYELIAGDCQWFDSVDHMVDHLSASDSLIDTLDMKAKYYPDVHRVVVINGKLWLPLPPMVYVTRHGRDPRRINVTVYIHGDYKTIGTVRWMGEVLELYYMALEVVDCEIPEYQHYTDEESFMKALGVSKTPPDKLRRRVRVPGSLQEIEVHNRGDNDKYLEFKDGSVVPVPMWMKMDMVTSKRKDREDIEVPRLSVQHTPFNQRSRRIFSAQQFMDTYLDFLNVLQTAGRPLMWRGVEYHEDYFMCYASLKEMDAAANNNTMRRA